MINDFYTQSILIQSKTTASNAIGGQIETWSTKATIDGYIDDIGGQKQEIAAQYTDKATHILMCSAGSDIDLFDRVYFNSETYRILHVDTVFGHHMEVLLEYVGVDNNE